MPSTDQWIHYDPKKDADELALVRRINEEVFQPINQERNRIAADSFEVSKQKEAAFPARQLPANATAAQTQLFNRPAYQALHSTDPTDRDEQLLFGLSQPAGDFATTGRTQSHIFGGRAPPGTVWSYQGPKAQAVGFDLDHTNDFEDKDDVGGYAWFKDSMHPSQGIFIPQLGFGQKPPTDTRQIMCGAAPVSKPGLSRWIGGPRGQGVTKTRLRDLLHGGKHFLQTDRPEVITGEGAILGMRPESDKPIYWYHRYKLPEHDNEEPEGKDKRSEIYKGMANKADAVMKEKRANLENLKQYYMRRAAFIQQYRNRLKQDH